MDNLNNIPNVGNWGDAASKLNDNFNKIKQAVTTVENASKNNKGYFASLSALNTAFPSPKAGQTAYVYGEASSTNYYIYNAVSGAWVKTSAEAPAVGVDLARYAKIDDLVQLAGETNPEKIVLEQGTMKDESGVEVSSESRIRSGYINCDLYSSFTVAEGFEFVSVRFFDKNKTYIGRNLDYYAVNYGNRRVTVPHEGSSYLRFIIKRSDSGNISPSDDVGLVVERLKEQIEKNRLLKPELYRALLNTGIQDLSLRRLTTQYLPYEMIRKVSVKDGFEFFIAEFDKNMGFIDNKYLWLKTADINHESGAEYCKISIRNSGDVEGVIPIDTDADHGLKIEYGSGIEQFDAVSLKTIKGKVIRASNLIELQDSTNYETVDLVPVESGEEIYITAILWGISDANYRTPIIGYSDVDRNNPQILFEIRSGAATGISREEIIIPDDVAYISFSSLFQGNNFDADFATKIEKKIPLMDKIDRLSNQTHSVYSKVDDNLAQLAGNTYTSNINFEQGSFSASSGKEANATNRVRSQILNYELYDGFRLNEGYKFLTVRAWDKSMNYIGSIASETFWSDSREIRLTDRNDIAYIRFVVRRDDNEDLTPSSGFEIEIFGIKKKIDNRIDKQVLPVKDFDASILTIPNSNVRISDGELASSSLTIATDYVDCAGYDVLQLEMLVGTTSPSFGLSFYDVSKGFIQSFPRPVGTPGSSFVGYNIPSNSAYFRVAYYADTSNRKPFTALLIKSRDEYAEFNGIRPSLKNKALIRYNTGIFYETQADTNSASDYVIVEHIDKIRLPMISGSGLSVTTGIAFYDSDKNYITGYLRPYTDQSPYYLYMTYDVPEGAVYVRSTWYSDTFLEEHPDFPDFRIRLIASSKKELGLLHNTSQRVRALENKVNVLPYYISGDFSKTYKFDYLGPTGSAMANLTTEYVYGLYDALQAEFPEMIERNLLGYATGTDGSPNVSYPIYEYHLKKPEEPAYYQNNTPLTPPPVILLLTGVHGLEKISVQSVYEFINAMLHTWRENDLLENLLFNFQYKIIPLANPWGYDNSIRNNARNVNINRNFEYNWEGQGNANERGEYPLSELETQILANWFENNKDALIEIDFHDTRYTDTSQNGLISYQATVNEYIPKVYSSYIRKMSRRWIDRYSIDTNYRVMGRVGYEAIAGTYTQAHHIAKIRNTSIIEINRTLWGQNYSQVACEISCEQVVNYLSSLIDYEIQRG